MIIECEKCGSRFNLDEARLKPEGSRLRCSVCKHVFRAYPPLPEEEEVLDMSFLEEPQVEEAHPDETEAISLDDLPEEVEQGSHAGLQGTGIWGRDRTDEFAEYNRRIAGEDMEEPFAADIHEMGARKGDIVGKKKSRPFLTILLVLFLILAGGGTALYFLAPDVLPIPFLKGGKQEAVADAGASRLSFEAVNGYFVQAQDGKQRFVITGKVINNYPDPRSFIVIAGALLDNKGLEIRKMNVYAGNILTEAQLKETPIERVNEILNNRFGTSRSNYNLAPGRGISFMIVFGDLPENMSEFTVEGVSSSPGQKS